MPKKNKTYQEIIPEVHDVLKVGLVIDSQICWNCKQASNYILGIEVIHKEKYKQLCSISYEKIVKLFNIEILKKYKIGEIKERYSHTMEKNYLSQGCYYCDALFGNFYIDKNIIECQINECWPDAVTFTKLTYKQFYELSSVSIAYTIQDLYKREEDYCKIYCESKYNSNEETKDISVLKDETFTINGLEFTIKRKAGLELYRGNYFLEIVNSVQGGKEIAKKMAFSLKALREKVQNLN